MAHVCTSCKRQVSNLPRSTSFPCPGCMKVEIVRCGHCRELATPYTCSSCNFDGPN